MINCIGEIMNAAKGAITRREAEDILKAIEKKFNEKMPKKDIPLLRRMELKKDPAAMTTQERMVLAAEEAFTDAVKEKKNTVKRAQLQVKSVADAQKKVATYGHGTKGVQEYLLRDVAAKARGIEELLMAELYQGLEPYMTATGHKMDAEQQLEVLQFISDPDLHNRHAAPDASPAEILARTWRAIEDRVHARKNGAGADIGYIPGHFPASWEPNSVRWFGLDWKEKINFLPGRGTRELPSARETSLDEMVNFLMPHIEIAGEEFRQPGITTDKPVAGKRWTIKSDLGKGKKEFYYEGDLLPKDEIRNVLLKKIKKVWNEVRDENYKSTLKPDPYRLKDMNDAQSNIESFKKSNPGAPIPADRLAFLRMKTDEYNASVAPPENQTMTSKIANHPDIRIKNMDKFIKIMDAKETLITRMREKARGAWVDYILPKLDRERYLDDTTGQQLDDDQMAKVMGNVWQTIASHGLSGLDPTTAAGGTSSLAVSLAAHREIHFKDPADFLAANNEFGTADLFTSMTANIRRHANDIAQLEALGPNPEAGFKSALAYGKQFGAEKSTYGREGSTMAERIWDEITGRSNQISEDKFDLIARVMQGARSMIVSAKLGMLPMSQLVDIASFHAIAKSDGLGMGEGYRAIFQMLNPMNKADRTLARKHGLLASMVINDVAMRYGDDTKGVGWTSRAADATVTYSGAKYWTDSMRQGFQLLISSHVAEARDLAFGELDPQFQLMMERNGITSEHWDIIRIAEAADIGGFSVVTPWMVKKAVSKGMDAAASAPGAKAAVAAERTVLEAAERYAALLAEEANIAILHPGKKEQAMIKWGTKPGEMPGELMRSVFMFKSFSLAILTKHLPRLTSNEFGSVKSRAEVGAQLLVGMMLTGALAIQLKDIFKGKNPRDMTDPAFWGAAFMQAGGLGIFGDFMLADANRFGGGFVSTIGGPVAGMVQDIQKLTVGNTMAAIDGKKRKKSGMEDLAGDSIQFAKNYAPLMNLWYTRLALDHLVFYQIQEAINPGYLQRMKRRTKSQNNQTFWWDPADHVPESGPSITEAFGGN